MSGPCYTVVCPTCVALPGEQCRTLTTNRVTDTHVARIDAQYPRCVNCGCMERTHPIPECRRFDGPRADS